MRRSRFACGVMLVVVGAGCHGRQAASRSDAPPPGSTIHIPLVRPPGTPSQDGREIDAPLAWIYLVDEPAPTGSAPDAIVAAVMPCGFRAVFGSVSPPNPPTLGVRVHAVFQGSGDPRAAQCDTRPVAVEIMSLQRLRLNTFTVTDATPHGPADPPNPSVPLHVVIDDPTTPAPMVRRYRACTPGDDTTCTGGGVCGGFETRSTGVCVPPFDPSLHAGRPCAEGRTDVTLTHAPMTGAAVPADGALHACLVTRDEAHPCHTSFECVQSGTHSVCLPRAR